MIARKYIYFYLNFINDSINHSFLFLCPDLFQELINSVKALLFLRLILIMFWAATNLSQLCYQPFFLLRPLTRSYHLVYYFPQILRMPLQITNLSRLNCTISWPNSDCFFFPWLPLFLASPASLFHQEIFIPSTSVTT